MAQTPQIRIENRKPTPKEKEQIIKILNKTWLELYVVPEYFHFNDDVFDWLCAGSPKVEDRHFIFALDENDG